MADRTLVAYERADGYDTHYAHDRPDPDRLTPATPFGGPAGRDLTRLQERLDPLGIDIDDSDAQTPVEPLPQATGVAWAKLVATLDYQSYAWCYRVDRDWHIEQFLVCHLGLGARGGAERDAVGDGLLLPVAGHEREYAHGWFEGTKAATADMMECGVFGEQRAREYMAGRIRSFAGDRACHPESE
ncbi:MAG: DUF6735 family protein [Halobacteriales archaeon]|nr:DUF6735 family protein [Halobacteriales archaeon]